MTYHTHNGNIIIVWLTQLAGATAPILPHMVKTVHLPRPFHPAHAGAKNVMADSCYFNVEQVVVSDGPSVPMRYHFPLR